MDTRVEILAEIERWAEGPPNTKRIFLLSGAAGSGKSAIAHTIASTFKKRGRLGASFAFDRDVLSRRAHHLFPHIAHLLSDQGDTLKRSLADVVRSDAELSKTTDIKMQFEHFVVRPLRGLDILQPILIVVDAIDEASDGRITTLRDLTSALRKGMEDLHMNIRFLITTRPESYILDEFEGSSDVLRMDMSEVPATDRDVLLYAQARLLHDQRKPLTGIDKTCCEKIASMSQGLFQWASVACNEIIDPKGSTSKQRYDRITSSAGGKQAGLLDTLYGRILEDHFDEDGKINFVDVMSFILTLEEPLPKSALYALWTASDREAEVLKIVLEGARSVMVGIGDIGAPVRLSHTSLRDFLVDRTRSCEFYITLGPAQHHHLTTATLGVMQAQLEFNMCKLPSSYLLNREVEDLDARVRKYIRPECAYSSTFWAHHIEEARGTGLYTSTEFWAAIEAFLREKLLFWMEVLSVRGKVGTAVPAIEKLVAMLAVRNHVRHLSTESDLLLCGSARRHQRRGPSYGCQDCSGCAQLCETVWTSRVPLRATHLALRTGVDLVRLNGIPFIRKALPWSSQSAVHRCGIRGSSSEAPHPVL